MPEVKLEEPISKDSIHAYDIECQTHSIIDNYKLAFSALTRTCTKVLDPDGQDSRRGA